MQGIRYKGERRRRDDRLNNGAHWRSVRREVSPLSSMVRDSSRAQAPCFLCRISNGVGCRSRIRAGSQFKTVSGRCVLDFQ